MTTIAYSKGIIATDSRLSEHYTICSDSYEKMVKIGHYKFFFSGDPANITQFADRFVNGCSAKDNIPLGIHAFVFDSKDRELWEAASRKGEPMYRFKLNLLEHWAIGSGGDWAVAAMDFGCTAQEAVKYAMTRDCRSGGKIRTYKLF